MIVKVQLSLHTTCAARQVLIYNEDRSVTYQGDITPDVAKIMGDENKAYFKAKLRRDGTIELFENYRIGDQAW